MCAEVVIDGDWIDSCGKLADALGCEVDDLIESPPFHDGLTSDECLCNVAIEATAKKFGYKAVQDWKTGCGEWVFRKRN